MILMAVRSPVANHAGIYLGSRPLAEAPGLYPVPNAMLQHLYGRLSERVVYRELFPSGLTLLDKGHLADLGTSHIIARQELRELIAELNLPGVSVAF